MNVSRRTKQQDVTCIAYNKRGRVLSIGHNNYVKTHTLQAKFAKRVGKPNAVYLHAEIDCLIKSRGQPIHKVVIIRRLHGNKHGLAKPCSICELALKEFGVRQIEHT